jgi:hypothetical protein
VLIVLATLLAAVGITSIWMNRQLLDTGSWVNTSDRMLQNDEIRSRLSDFLAEQLVSQVDVESHLRKAGVPGLSVLTGPAVERVQEHASGLAEKALSTPQFETLWRESNRAAHRTLLLILDEKDSAVRSEGGNVVIDLRPTVREIGEELGLGDLSSQLPAGVGRLRVLRSDQLSTAQQVVRVIRDLSVVTVLLVAVLYAASLVLAGPARRRAIAGIGLSLILAGAIGLVVRAVVGDQIVDDLVSSDSVRPAADAVWGIATSTLVTIASAAIGLGALVAAGAWLAGPSRVASSLRRAAAPSLLPLRGRVTAAVIVALCFLILVALAPISALRQPLGIVLFALVIGVGVELLGRQALHELPETG